MKLNSIFIIYEQHTQLFKCVYNSTSLPCKQSVKTGKAEKSLLSSRKYNSVCLRLQGNNTMSDFVCNTKYTFTQKMVSNALT